MKFASCVAAAGLAVGMFAFGPAQAMPVSAPSAVTAPSEGVILARAGCGYGAHRGPYGGCRLNRGPRGAIRQAITGAPGGCRPGFYRVRGFCRPR